MDSNQFLVGVVDDDFRVLESFEELLASGGYKVLSFSSAEAFIAANGFQQVDCLISDIAMPTMMSGWDLLRFARTEHPGIPVILITAQEQDYSREVVEARGGRYFFRKPFDGRELLSVLDGILRPV